MDTRLYPAEYYEPKEITDLIHKIQEHYRYPGIAYSNLVQTVINQLDMHLTPWELAATIEKNLTDNPNRMWLGLYKALYYVDREDTPLGINSSMVLLKIGK